MHVTAPTPLVASAVVVAAGQQVSFGPLGELLTILGAVGGLATLIGALVVLWKGRAEKSLAESGRDLNAVQMMNTLFERQKEQNLETLAARDAEIVRLQAEIEHSTGNRRELEHQLAICVRERLVIRNQLAALDRTIEQTQREQQERGGS